MSIEAMKQALDALENHTAIKHPQQRHYRDSAIDALRAAIKEAEKHEPVAWMFVNTDGECEQIEFSKNWPVPDDPSVTRLYAAPREWQGLTDEEIEEACVPLGAAMLSFTEVARAIEVKLKEKNG